MLIVQQTGTMKLEFLVLLASLGVALAAPMENQQAKGPISLSFSSKELFEALGLGGLSVSLMLTFLDVSRLIRARDIILISSGGVLFY